MFKVGTADVESVTATGNGKVEYVGCKGHSLAHVKSAMDSPAYYPVHPVKMEKPIKAVLMDLDNPRFELEQADLPFVSGDSVSDTSSAASRSTVPTRPWKRPGGTIVRISGGRCTKSWKAEGGTTPSLPRPA
jgi:hypothetical protein